MPVDAEADDKDSLASGLKRDYGLTRQDLDEVLAAASPEAMWETVQNKKQRTRG